MSVPIQPVNNSPLRLASGCDVLDRWARGATETAKTAIYEVLFAITEKSVFRDYVIIDDAAKATEFFVPTRCGLAVKIRIHSMESFQIVYIGSLCGAPGLDEPPDDGRYGAA
jgi:hypothetical protein